LGHSHQQSAISNQPKPSFRRIADCWLLTAGCLLVLFPLSASAEFDLSQSVIPIEQIVDGGPPKDGIPAILVPRFGPAAKGTTLPADELVVGVEEGHEAKAYPLRILNWHEVVNDFVGGRPIAVTWCPLTHTAIAVDRRVGGQTFTFGVSGKLWNSHLLMYDHQTESLWSPMALSAVAGPQHGQALIQLPARLTTWDRWHTAHPTTVVLSPTDQTARDYAKDPYTRYQSQRGLWFPVEPTSNRLPAKTLVFGLVVNGVAAAYPLAMLEAGAPMHDMVGDTAVTIQADTPQTARATDAEGRLLPGIVAYWFAWYAFHPETAVHAPAVQPTPEVVP